LIKKILAGKEIGKQNLEKILFGKMNNRVIFTLFLKKNSILHELMKMQAVATPGMSGVIGSFGDLFMSCERDDSYFSLHMEIEMLKSR